MSEQYEVVTHRYPDGYTSYKITRDGKNVMTGIHNKDQAEWLKGKFETETAPLLERIAELEAALAEARNFVRYTFPLQDPSDIRYGNRDAEILLAKWGMMRDETEADEHD